MSRQSEHDALLWDVLCRPEDDVPRLLYADWCDDNGQAERAEFIRVQVELAGPYDKVKPSVVLRRKFLRKRARHLLRLPYIKGVLCNGFLWSEPLHELGLQPSSWSEDCFGRGFVHQVSLTCADYMATAGKLFALHPITEVELTDREVARYSDAPAVWLRSMAGEPGWEGWGEPGLNYVPGELLDLMTGKPGGWLIVARKHSDRLYDSEQDATLDLSRACIAWGRQQAGLPPLRTPASPPAPP